MNKGELIAGMAEESGVSKADTEKVLNAFLSQVEKALCAGDKVQLRARRAYRPESQDQRAHCDPSREDASL